MERTEEANQILWDKLQADAQYEWAALADGDVDVYGDDKTNHVTFVFVDEDQEYTVEATLVESEEFGTVMILVKNHDGEIEETFMEPTGINIARFAYM